MTAPLQPPDWPRPSGYANGIAATGETDRSWPARSAGTRRAGLPTARRRRWSQALRNMLLHTRRGGRRAGDIAAAHLVRHRHGCLSRRARPDRRGVSPRHGRQFPVMSVVEVTRLVERAALVEIEATAVLAARG